MKQVLITTAAGGEERMYVRSVEPYCILDTLLMRGSLPPDGGLKKFDITHNSTSLRIEDLITGDLVLTCSFEKE
jgi:hypothetical protein